MDSLAKPSEEGFSPFDIYREQKELFQLAGQILFRYPEEINVHPEFMNGKLNRLWLETQLFLANKKRAGLRVYAHSIQTKPEIRVRVLAENSRQYEVRVSVLPTDIDQSIDAALRAVGIDGQKRIFTDQWGETRGMDVGDAIECLSQVTRAHRPDHNVFTDVTLKELPAGFMKSLTGGAP